MNWTITDAYYKEMTITYVITNKHLDNAGESISLTAQEIYWRLILVVHSCCWLHGWTADTDTPIGSVVRIYVQKGKLATLRILEQVPIIREYAIRE